MKRYRIIHNDLDTRATILNMEIKDEWDKQVKDLWHHNKKQIREGLLHEFGSADYARKIDDFQALGPFPYSIMAFHNNFLRQARNSFVVGSYYPALTSACALGERVLNHLILNLRDFHKNTQDYKNVYKKQSFDSWDLAINTLSNWKVLLPEATAEFRTLHTLRNKAIHFNPITDTNDRTLALEAISTLSKIIEFQFTAHGTPPWFIPGAKGATFIKKECEQLPFVKTIYLPSCALVGPLHKLKYTGLGFKVVDDHLYENREVTDDEFIHMANSHSLTPRTP